MHKDLPRPIRFGDLITICGKDILFGGRKCFVVIGKNRIRVGGIEIIPEVLELLLSAWKDRYANLPPDEFVFQEDPYDEHGGVIKLTPVDLDKPDLHT
jgi:hypothetical protein